MTPIALVCFVLFLNCKNSPTKTEQPVTTSQELAGQMPNKDSSKNTIHYPAEKHLKNVKQLTFGGNNAEAYWSFDGKMLVFQSDNPAWGAECDQIYYFNPNLDDLSKNKPHYISRRGGRTTCSYFMPGDSMIIFASTHRDTSACPPVPERTTGGKYVWPIYSSFDIYVADLKGNLKKQLTNIAGYDAEATVSPKGNKIIYTALRQGDLNLWIMDIDGKNKKQITFLPGYDGGAFFSPDGNSIVFRASRPKDSEARKEYYELLQKGLVQPTEMEIFTCNLQGGNYHQVTNLGKANWAPFYHPSGKKIIFSSNHAAPKGYQFNLYLINLDGTGLEQITFDSVFDSFPMFSPDGKRLVWASNRNNGGTHDTNLFMAEWVD
ncbi:MAG: PD40 domain-containing protein [Saprospiraceae bacterium]|nr:PD40 domain-containing protein [Saprospiraceae bacterium]